MKLKVSIVQTDIVWGDAVRNLKAAQEKIESLSGDTDIVVLPEMFGTGFMTDTDRHIESMNGEIVTRMKAMAVECGVAVCGSVAIREDASGLHRNRFVFAKPDGSIHTYDKSHLFSYGGEDKHYVRGNKRVVFEYGGFRIMPQICYDLRFPVWSRNRGDYDLLIYVASWPSKRVSAWDTLLKARAIENQCYVIGANRVGNDPTAEYCGHSTAVDFKGEVMCGLPDGAEGIMNVELEMESLLRFRDKFRVWEDADAYRFE